MIVAKNNLIFMKKWTNFWAPRTFPEQNNPERKNPERKNPESGNIYTKKSRT